MGLIDFIRAIYGAPEYRELDKEKEERFILYRQIILSPTGEIKELGDFCIESEKGDGFSVRTIEELASVCVSRGVDLQKRRILVSTLNSPSITGDYGTVLKSPISQDELLEFWSIYLKERIVYKLKRMRIQHIYSEPPNYSDLIKKT